MVLDYPTYVVLSMLTSTSVQGGVELSHIDGTRRILDPGQASRCQVVPHQWHLLTYPHLVS